MDKEFTASNFIPEKTSRHTRYKIQDKIQETLFRVNFQIYNNIKLAMGYFVDNMKY